MTTDPAADPDPIPTDNQPEGQTIMTYTDPILVADAYVALYESHPKMATEDVLAGLAEEFSNLNFPTRWTSQFEALADDIWNVECEGREAVEIARYIISRTR